MASLLILQTATDAGLASCFIGVPTDREAAVCEAFGIPAEFEPVGVVTIGHHADRGGVGAAGSPTRRARKRTADVVHRGRWGAQEHQPSPSA